MSIYPKEGMSDTDFILLEDFLVKARKSGLITEIVYHLYLCGTMNIPLKDAIKTIAEEWEYD
jgi:hypothetical protein